MSTTARLVEPGLRAEPVPHAPVLLDFCAARMARNPTTRLRDAWLIPPPETTAAVAAWRRERGMTVSECARAAGVSCGAWGRFEVRRIHRIERAFPAWAILTWVMAMGGPAVDLGGAT